MLELAYLSCYEEGARQLVWVFTLGENDNDKEILCHEWTQHTFMTTK